MGYLSAGGLENVFQLVTVYIDSNENVWIDMYQLPGEGRGVPLSVRMCFDVLAGTILAETKDEGTLKIYKFFARMAGYIQGVPSRRCRYLYYIFNCQRRNSPPLAYAASLLRFLDHTQLDTRARARTPVGLL